MDDQNLAGTPGENQPQAQTPGRSPRRTGRGLKAAGLVAAGVIAGGTLAATMTAVAAETPTPSTTSNGGTNETPQGNGYGTPPNGTPPNGTAPDGSARNGTAPNGAQPDGRRGPGGPQAMRSDEKVLTGTDLEKAKAAALKAVPGGTVVRAETDAGDAEYEVHMTKADGAAVTVKLDKSFVVTEVEDGMGKGDPATGGPQDQPSSTTSNSSSDA